MGKPDHSSDIIALLDTQQWETTWEDLSVAETIVPRASEAPKDLSATVQTLPQLTTEQSDELEIGDALGEGGMGVVHLARQRSLDRDVAVKRLRSEHRSPENIQHLLHEARLTGELDHPNIVPVYVLGQDTDETLLFVMKRIEGTSWLDFLNDSKKSAERSPTGDPLDFHISVLMSVCQAVHFAHSRGIVHRDIKPENVMLGDFGEVYLVDWGIAMRLSNGDEPPSDASTHDESASAVRSIAGTPVFMAPEQVLGDLDTIGPRTDVYLLGATLHLFLTRQPRHAGESLPEILENARASEPFEYDESVPAELGAIANRAMHVMPDQRFESADAFRRAIAGYLTHRASARLCHEATRRLDEMQHLMLVEGEVSQAVRQEIYPVFSECRFGFRQALIEWRDNEAAVDGLQKSLELMIDLEIRQRSPAAAASLLVELPTPNAALEARVEELERHLLDEEADVARLRRMRQNIDVHHGAHTRSIIALLLALLWGVPDTIIGLLEATGSWHPSYTFLIARTLAFSVILAIPVMVKRDEVFGNVANRRIVGAAFVIMATELMIWIVAWRMALSVDAAASFITVSLGAIVVLIALTIDIRIWISSACFFAGAIACAIWPEPAFVWLGASAIAGLVALAVVWRGAPSTAQRTAAT